MRMSRDMRRPPGELFALPMIRPGPNGSADRYLREEEPLARCARGVRIRARLRRPAPRAAAPRARRPGAPLLERHALRYVAGDVAELGVRVHGRQRLTATGGTAIPSTDVRTPHIDEDAATSGQVHAPIRSRIIRCTSPPSARPLVSRITAPTIAPIALALPDRIFSTASAFCSSARSTISVGSF